MNQFIFVTVVGTNRRVDRGELGDLTPTLFPIRDVKFISEYNGVTNLILYSGEQYTLLESIQIILSRIQSN
jgi:hypothetical protein